MLKSSAGNDQSVQTTTCAICGSALTFVIVKIVVRAVVCGELKSTSKYGSNSVAAGAVLMSQLSSLFVVVGPNAAPPTPNWKVASGLTTLCVPANAEPAIASVAIRAHTKNFLICYLLH